jgi:hypothetical protein
MDKPNYLLLFFVLVLVGISSACTDADEENFDHVILGVWYQSSPFHDDPSRVYRNQYHFKPDGTFEYSSRVMTVGEEGTTEQGYMARHTGTFRLAKNTLILEIVRYYGLDGVNEMLPKEDLTEQARGLQEEAWISFNKKRDELAIEKPCADFASCLPVQVYSKAN